MSSVSEGEASDGLSKQLEALMKQMVADQQHLSAKIDTLMNTMRDLDNQQRAHNVDITRLEHGTGKQAVTLDAARQHSGGLLPKPMGSPPATAASTFSFPHDDLAGALLARGKAEGRAPGRNGVPQFRKLNFPTYGGKDDPCHGLTAASNSSEANVPWRKIKFGWLPCT